MQRFALGNKLYSRDEGRGRAERQRKEKEGREKAQNYADRFKQTK